MSDPAPPPLEAVRQFLNSLDVEAGKDEFASPEATMDWLHQHEMCDPGCTTGPPDVPRLRAFREAVRDFVEYGGRELPQPSRELLEREMARCPLVLTFCGEGNADVRLQPMDDNADTAAVASILAMIREAQLAGTWTRLRICRADDCRWAFYDRSRNASAHWCSMAVCGNRAKARRHRERSGTGSDQK